MRRVGWLLSFCVGWALWCGAGHGSDKEAIEADEQWLRKEGIPSDGSALIEFLRLRTVRGERRELVAGWIARLGDDAFEVREEALRSLVGLGPEAIPGLREAAKSTDLEVRQRAKDGLRLIERQNQPETVSAAIRLLANRRPAGAAEAILAFVPSAQDDLAAEETRIALRKLAFDGEAPNRAILAAAKEADPRIRASAGEALIRSGRADVLAELRSLLEDKERTVRCAAAVAFTLRKERQAVPVLIDLVAEGDTASRVAEEMLYQLAGENSPERRGGAAETAGATRREDWRRWWETNSGRADLFDSLAAGRVERFATPSADATKGYGAFTYEATAEGCKAAVANGRLTLGGDHEEGDQRLAISSQKVWGQGEWPNQLEVGVKLGGTAGENGGWHVGVSIGRVKVLFHPNYPEGAFRAESVDTHEYYFNSEGMGFTPVTGALHAMKIKVRRNAKGYQFDVTVAEAQGKGKHRKTFEVSNEQMGRFNRIGLERSGRRGGDALFESLSIQSGLARLKD